MKKNSGNVLFIILIAIALFGALSYAMTQTGRGSGNVEKETVLLNAAQLTQYAVRIQEAIQRITLVSDCSETDISFDDTKWVHTDYRHAPVVADKCKVFGSGGGQAPFPSVPPAISSLPWEFEGGPRVMGFGGDGAASTDADLVMYLPGLSLETCNALNVGFNHGFSSPPTDKGDTVEVSPSRFKGIYSTNDTISGDLSLSCPSPLCKKAAACFKEQTGNQYYIFYTVLIAR